MNDDEVRGIAAQHAELETLLRSDLPSTWSDVQRYRRTGRAVWFLRRAGRLPAAGARATSAGLVAL